MSKRLITIDDHAGTPIDEAQSTQTLARIVIAREGSGEVIEWDALNLSDESWDELVKTLREFCPDAQPVLSPESEAHALTDADADAAAQAEYEAQQGQAQREAQRRVEATQTPKATAPKATTARASSAPLSQGEARKRSAAVRSWWQSLTPAALKALGLPEAKAGPGRMPPAVTDAYNAAHSS